MGRFFAGRDGTAPPKPYSELRAPNEASQRFNGSSDRGRGRATGACSGRDAFEVELGAQGIPPEKPY